MPSKKERARQRRAAKRAAAAPPTPVPTAANATAAGAAIRREQSVLAPRPWADVQHPAPSLRGSDEARRRNYASKIAAQPQSVINEIVRGETLATEFVAFDLCEEKDSDEAELAFFERVSDKAGPVIVATLGFFETCKRSAVQDATTRFGPSYPVVDPTLWVMLLERITRYGAPIDDHRLMMCRLQIAKGISPLVRCMCSSSRTFFLSKGYWYETVMPFLCLLSNIALTTETHDDLLGQKGLLEFAVQAMFWESHRPDLVRESKSYGEYDFCSFITGAGVLIRNLVSIGEERGFYKHFDENATNQLHHIGCTPILGKSYRKKGSTATTFVAGLTHLLLAKQNELPTFVGKSCRVILGHLVQSGCVDKDVISGLMLCLTKSSDAANAAENLLVLYDALCPLVGEHPSPHGNRFAFAIDKGLLVYCLEITVRFKDVGDGKLQLLGHLDLLMRAALSVSFQAKASKAVSKHLNFVAKILPQSDTALKNSSRAHKVILRTVTMIAALHTGIRAASVNCLGCKKDLPATDAKHCRKCSGVFCSSKCQKESWRRGDKCCSEKAAHREAKLKLNINTAVGVIMVKDRENLFAQATLQNYDITDCVVVINLIRPPLVRVVLASQFIEERGTNQLKQMIVHARSEGCLTTVVDAFSSDVDERGRLQRQSMVHRYPCSPLESWDAAHSRFGKGMKLKTAIMQSEDLRARFGIFFCEWYDLFMVEKRSSLLSILNGSNHTPARGR